MPQPAGETARGRRTDVPPRLRIPLLVLGFVGLVVGVGAGLARLGVAVPALAAGAASLHGPLMIGGFFGVVIALERAVAIGRRWAYAAPLCVGIGTLVLLAGARDTSAWLVLAGSLVLLAATLDVFWRQRALFTFTLVAAVGAWIVGNAGWLAGLPVHAIVPWWLAFPILTIAGERLELSRFLPPSPRARIAFGTILAGAFAFPALAALGSAWAMQAFGGVLLALALWLGKQDVARRTVRGTGLTRFIAVCLLSGYAWLAVGGGIILARGLAPGTPAYDAALHTLAIGFVFAMVFGHAPIIFPAVLKVAVPYHPAFYAPLGLLHASLALRLAGDAAGDFALARAGALGNALALAAFIAATASAVVRGRRPTSSGA